MLCHHRWERMMNHTGEAFSAMPLNAAAAAAAPFYAARKFWRQRGKSAWRQQFSRNASACTRRNGGTKRSKAKVKAKGVFRQSAKLSALRSRKARR